MNKLQYKMKKIKLRPTTLLAAAALLVTTSCNRGLGCPTNFSLNDSLIDTVVEVLKLIF